MKTEPIINKLYAFYDIKSQTYSDLMCVKEEAIHEWCGFLANEHTGHPNHTHPEDYVIYEYGIWENGKIIMHEERKIFGSLSSYKKLCKECLKNG
ncbi:MAG: hypothetical protein [Microviridae sp.]|nr:MAG: hypothetical protein [Microviridae sp.]